MILKEIEEKVVNSGFGITLYDTAKNGESIYISKGMEIACNTESILPENVLKAVETFCGGDFGTFYDWDEHPTEGAEYGEYISPIGNTANTGAIMVHRERGKIVVYFQFER